MREPVSHAVRDAADDLVIRLAGDLSSSADFSGLVEAVDRRLMQAPKLARIVLDVGDVAWVTSGGLLRFSGLVTQIAARCGRIAVRLCHAPVLRTILLSMELSSKVSVETVFLPYSCEECEVEQERLVDTGAEIWSTIDAPGAPCPQCGEAMELDEITDIYEGLRRCDLPGPADVGATAHAPTEIPPTRSSNMSSDSEGSTEDLIGPIDDASVIGRVILDQFRVLKLLGTGGMSSIYLAQQINMDRHAAIKILKIGGQRARERFQREARAASRLAHPNIVTVYNFGELDGGNQFLAMEYLDGHTLGKIIEREAPLSLDRAFSIAFQCASAIAFAHSCGVIHRDLKPDNIMIVPSPAGEQVKILDFGVAFVTDSSSKTGTNEIVGTPQYMSPEQFEAGEAKAASDQYCLGLILYELITGRPAVSGTSLMACIKQHLMGQLAPPSALRNDPAVRLLDPILSRMLEKKPENRFPSMTDVVDALQKIARYVSESSDVLPALSVSGDESEPPVVSIPCAQPIFFVGRALFADAGAPETLKRLGFEAVHFLGEARELTPRPEGLYVLSAEVQDWTAAFEAWVRGGLPLERTLLCVDADPLSSEIPP